MEEPVARMRKNKIKKIALGKPVEKFHVDIDKILKCI